MCRSGIVRLSAMQPFERGSVVVETEPRRRILGVNAYDAIRSL